jgi:hypothetical protein
LLPFAECSCRAVRVADEGGLLCAVAVYEAKGGDDSTANLVVVVLHVSIGGHCICMYGHAYMHNAHFMSRAAVHYEPPSRGRKQQKRGHARVQTGLGTAAVEGVRSPSMRRSLHMWSPSGSPCVRCQCAVPWARSSPGRRSKSLQVARPPNFERFDRESFFCTPQFACNIQALARMVGRRLVCVLGAAAVVVLPSFAASAPPGVILFQLGDDYGFNNVRAGSAW